MKSSDRSFEHRLVTALHAAPTPEGLCDRLLAAVLSAPVGDSSSEALQPVASSSIATLADAAGATVDAAGSMADATGATADAAVERETAAPRVLRFPRFLRAATPGLARKISRRSALAAGALAASLLLGGFAWWSLRSAVDPRADLATLAANWVPRLSNTWKPMGVAPSGFPASTALSGSPHGWQSATNVVGNAAVVYDISRPGLRAVLFAVRMAAPQLPFGPPLAPLSTGGQAIATWRSGALVYVLVVEGDERNYRSLIRSVAPPLA